MILFVGLHWPLKHPQQLDHLLNQWMVTFDWNIGPQSTTIFQIFDVWTTNSGLYVVELIGLFLITQSRPLLALYHCMCAKPYWGSMDRGNHTLRWPTLLAAVVTFTYFGTWLLIAGRILSSHNVAWRVLIAAFPHGGIEYLAYVLPLWWLLSPTQPTPTYRLRTAAMGLALLFVSAWSEVLIAPHVGLWLHVHPSVF